MAKKDKKPKIKKYYSVQRILKILADYNIIIGKRSNGKTYSVLEYGLIQYLDGKGQLGIIRRWDEDFKGKNGAQQFDGFINNFKGNQIAKLSKGKWNNVVYASKRWYLARYDEDGKLEEKDETPFAMGFAISNEEHYKSYAYPLITTILFDEFITRKYYLPDEFVTYMNLLSTIIRDRKNVKIFMCGNTINKVCPYFNEMGLKKITQMKKGNIDIYSYGESSLRVAVEYCGDTEDEDEENTSNKYFAFNNPKLLMITHGEWEIGIHPHLPVNDYRPSEIIYIYFIVFDGETLQCEIIQHDTSMFTYIHRKTTPIKDDGYSFVYQEDYDPRPNYRRKINKPTTRIEKIIATQFIQDKIFYQDNDVGELVRNYLNWCKTSE